MSSKNFERVYEGWHVCREYYGTVASAEATLVYQKDRFYLGVGLNIGFEGNYQLRISDLKFAESGKFSLFLAKKITSVKGLCSITFEPETYGIKKGVPFRLKLECNDGLLRGYLNGIPLIDYDDSLSEERFLQGYCGVWIHPVKAAEIIDFNCNGVWTTPPETEIRFNGREQSYSMDMLIADSNGILAEWATAYNDADWSVKESAGERVYTPNTEKFSATHIHVFEKDPSISSVLSFGNVKNGGKAGIYLRHAPDTAFIEVGYDAAQKCWYLYDTPALYDCRTAYFTSDEFVVEQDRKYRINIIAKADSVTVSVDGKTLIEAGGIRQTGYGRIGLFNDGIAMAVHSFEAETPFASEPQKGVKSGFVHTDRGSASSELEFAPDGSILAITKVFDNSEDKPYHTGVYRSTDEGLSFTEIDPGKDYSELDVKGKYQSIIKLKNGKYLQVLLARDTVVQISDDLINWQDIGRVVGPEEIENGYVIYHTSSLAEFTNANGKTRLFMPIVASQKVIDPVTKLLRPYHDTWLYYSDDNGYNWRRSKLSTNELLKKAGHGNYESYAECKLVLCRDGSMRLYNSRNDSLYICYSESFDFGETWEGIYEVKELQCAKSSFAITEDPFESGTFYLAWVNDKPMSRGNHNGRTRISLVRSYDGKNWEFLCDVERMSLRFADEMPHLYIPLFQILDPAVAIAEKYVYVTYGISRFSCKDAVPGSAEMVHHIQCPAVVRFEKDKLFSKPWDEITLCDIALLDKKEGK